MPDAQDAREAAWRDYFNQYDTSRIAFDAIWDAGVASERERVSALIEALVAEHAGCDGRGLIDDLRALKVTAASG